MIKFTKNHFKTVRDITWDDIIKKISVEFQNKTVNFIAKDSKTPPTFALHNNYYPLSIKKAYDEVHDALGITEMHVYTSFGFDSSSYGKHKDTMDVLIVQSIGTMIYKFDNDIKYTLDPGDSVFIPKGEYHEPFILEPRVTLSFSWD